MESEVFLFCKREYLPVFGSLIFVFVFCYIVPFYLQSVLVHLANCYGVHDLKRGAHLHSSLMSRLEASCDFWGSAYYLDL